MNLSDSRSLSYLSLAVSVLACVFALLSLASGSGTGRWSIEGANGELIEIDAERGEIRAVDQNGNYLWKLGKREGGAALELHASGSHPLVVLQTRTPEFTVNSSANHPFISASSSGPIGPHFSLLDASGRFVDRLSRAQSPPPAPGVRSESK
jgi:hypothetical protein